MTSKGSPLGQGVLEVPRSVFETSKSWVKQVSSSDFISDSGLVPGRF